MSKCTHCGRLTFDTDGYCSPKCSFEGEANKILAGVVDNSDKTSELPPLVSEAPHFGYDAILD